MLILECAFGVWLEFIGLIIPTYILDWIKTGSQYNMGYRDGCKSREIRIESDRETILRIEAENKRLKEFIKY